MPHPFTIRPYEASDLECVVELCRAEGWGSYTSDATARAFSAPGVIAACVESAQGVIAFGYVQTDGVIQAHLSLLVVGQAHRRQGVGSALVRFLFEASGASRLDLIADDEAAFYRTFPHKEWPGFRVYPSSGGWSDRSTDSDWAGGSSEPGT